MNPCIGVTKLNFRLDPESARTVINACKSTDTRDKSSIIPWEACETCIFSHNIDGQGKVSFSHHRGQSLFSEISSPLLSLHAMRSDHLG